MVKPEPPQITPTRRKVKFKILTRILAASIGLGSISYGETNTNDTTNATTEDETAVILFTKTQQLSKQTKERVLGGGWLDKQKEKNEDTASIWDHLKITLDVGLKYTDNLYLNDTNKESDLVSSLTPGLELSTSNNSLFQGKIIAQEVLNAYLEHGENNNYNTKLLATGRYEIAKTIISGELGFTQRTESTAGTNSSGAMTEWNTYNFATKVDYTLNPKSHADASLLWATNIYKTKGFTDQTNITLPLNVFYSVTPKMDLSSGIEIQKTDIKTAYNPITKTNDAGTSIFYNVGAHGNFTSKIAGDINVGYTTKSYTHNSSNSNFGLRSRITYSYTEKTQIVVGLSNEFNSSEQGQEQKVTTLTLGASNQTTDYLGFSVTSSFETRKYINTNQIDNIMQITADTTYKLTKDTSIRGYYSVITNNGKNSVDFVANTIGINLSTKF
jgi:hypothetical protein